MEAELEYSLSEILEILIKRIWVIILCTVLFAGGAFLVTKYVVPEKYTSSVSMYVLPNSNNTNIIASLSELNYAQEIVNTYIEILKTDVFLKSVGAASGLEYTPVELSNMIEMKAVNNTEIFEVIITTLDPKESLLIANTISVLAPRKIIEIKNADDVKVVDPATLPTSPSGPNVVKNTAIGLVLGLMLGVMLAFIINIFDKRVKDEDDLAKRYSVPVLGSVPVIKG